MNIIGISFFLPLFLFQLSNSAYVDIKTVMAQGQGFSITGVPLLGKSVDGIGDFNGDGYDDIIITSFWKFDPLGPVYVIYGSKSPHSETRVDQELPPSEGFVIRETEPESYLGYFASGIGDINGDGLADIMVGAKEANKGVGAAYVIFGNRTPLSTLFPQQGLDPSQGFAILGSLPNEEMGASGSRAGDINGDGIDDFMVGTDRYGYTHSKVYVIFGSKQAFSTMIPSQNFTLSQGFIISGADESYEQMGSSLSKAGDINGDGIDDIIIGAVTSNQNAGAAYVIYGSREPFQNITPSLGLPRSQGFAILGKTPSENVGESVSGAGDVNGDGIDDVIIGAYSLANWRGAAYVIYGNKNSSSTIVPNASLDASQGFAMYGDIEHTALGQSVSGIGDINQDGFDDLIIVASLIHGGLGEAYLIYGKKNHTSFVIPATGLDSSQGIVFHGQTLSEGKPFYVGASANAGDVNGDGIDDIILGCTNAYTAYIIYGWSKVYYFNLKLTYFPRNMQPRFLLPPSFRQANQLPLETPNYHLLDFGSL